MRKILTLLILISLLTTGCGASTNEEAEIDEGIREEMAADVLDAVEKIEESYLELGRDYDDMSEEYKKRIEGVKNKVGDKVYLEHGEEYSIDEVNLWAKFTSLDSSYYLHKEENEYGELYDYSAEVEEGIESLKQEIKEALDK